MQRRKFIIGTGALAAGGAAALGSGAFSSVEADRDVTVEVADDADAFLALEVHDDANGAYAEETGGTIEFNFDGDADTEGGSGISDEAFWNFEDVFVIENQGTQPVGVQLEFLDDDGDQFIPGNPALASVSGPVERTAEGGWYTLDDGEEVDVGFFFNLRKDELGDDLEDLDTIVVHADVDEADENGDD